MKDTTTRDTIATPPNPDAAAAWLRDLLEQLGPQADAVLATVLAGRDVRGLRVVGPLRLATSGREGQRYSLTGIVGGVAIAGADPRLTAPPGQWLWSVTGVAAAGSTPDPWPTGYEPTRLAADRALCLALQSLGWAPVEIPSEEQVAEEEAREAQAQENAQNAMAAGTGVPRELLFGAQPQWTRTSPTARAPSSRERIQQAASEDLPPRFDTQVRPRPHDDGAAALRHARRTLDSTRRLDGLPDGTREIEVRGWRYLVMEGELRQGENTLAHMSPVRAALPAASVSAPTTSRVGCEHTMATYQVTPLPGHTILMSRPCQDNVVIVEPGRALDDVRAVLEVWSGEAGVQPPVQLRSGL